MTTPRRLFAAITALSMTAALAACDDQGADPMGPEAYASAGSGQVGPPPALSVFTQNVYVGGDTGPLFTIDLSNIPAVIAGANVFLGDVEASDVPGRMATIVERIDVERPHLVGLQEVVRFLILDGSFSPVGAIDFLAYIEAEIAARGLPYVTEVVQETSTATLPLAFDPAVGISRWLNFTDRVVVLRRTDVELVDEAGGLYLTSLPVGPLEFERGWARATVRHRDVTYHFVTTHLETQAAPPVQAGQAAELHGVVNGLGDGVTIIAGDLNSNAAAGPGNPTWTPTYDSFVDAGFSDVWATAPRRTGGDGLTCCHPHSLTGDLSFSQRIDFVMVRASGEDGGRLGGQLGTFFVDVVGEELLDQTAGGLWPSDHAGLLAAFGLPAWLQ